MNPFEEDLFRPVVSVDDSLFAPFVPASQSTGASNDPLKNLSLAGDPVRFEIFIGVFFNSFLFFFFL
jgi:hypothetical protein